MSLLTYISLLVFGVPYAFLLALSSGVFGLIPFGTLIATIPALIISFLSGGVPMVIIVSIIYFLLHQIENYILREGSPQRVVDALPGWPRKRGCWRDGRLRGRQECERRVPKQVELRRSRTVDPASEGPSPGSDRGPNRRLRVRRSWKPLCTQI